MSFRITTTGFEEVDALIQNIPVAIEQLGEPIAVVVERQIARRISTEKSSPDGRAWPAWSGAYARGGQGRELLEQSGRLLSSIRSTYDGDGIEAGSDLDYALAQNVRRPFLGIGADDEREIQTVLEAELTRRLGVG